MKGLLLLSLICFTIGCTNSNGTRELLEKQGYTNIEITGYSWFACSKDDSLQTGFKAMNSNGAVVKGTVCEGLLLKGKTIRFN